MEIILSTFYALLFLWVIRKAGFYRISQTGPNAASILFLAKLAAGVALGLVYTYYYTDRHTADTFRLFDDSAVVFNTLKSSPSDFFSMMTGIGGGAPHLEPVYNKMNNWYDVYSPVNDNRFMIRLNVILRFFSFGHYYVHVVFVAFLSLTGTIALIKFASLFITDCNRLLYLALGYLPSVLFWGSGLMKDAVVIFALGSMLYFFGKVLHQSHGKYNQLLLLISLLFLTFSRFQILVVILPGLVAWMLVSFKGTKPLTAFTLSALFFLTIATVLPIILPGADLPALLYAKQQSFLNLATEKGAGSLIDPVKFNPNITSILLNAPEAFFTALTRPFIQDCRNPLLALSAAETFLILGFGLFCILKSDRKTIWSNPLFLFSAQMVLISYTLIGLVTPVLGAMVRYKTPALPFLLIAFLILLPAAYRSRLNQLSKKLAF